MGLSKLEVEVDGSIFSAFADLTRDKNLIHRDKSVAHRMGFEDTPLQGVYIIALFEKMALQNGFSFDNYSVSFKNPAYPGDIITFKGTSDDRSALFEARVGDKLISACKIDFSEPMQQVLQESPVASFNYNITSRELSSFRNCIELRKGGSSSLVGSLIPASLLRIASNDQGIPIGIYRSISVRFFEDFSPGEPVDVNIYNRGKPREKGGTFFYNMCGVCFQDGNPLLEGDLAVVSPERINFG